MTREKKLRYFIHRHSFYESGKSTLGFLLEHYYDESIDIMLRFPKAEKYSNAMRYTWALVPGPDSPPMHRVWTDWVEVMIGLGHFQDGPGWYSYVQTGRNGVFSNLIFAPLLCNGRNEAYRIASSRSERGYVVPKKDVNAMVARINLLGQAVSEV